MKFLRNPIVRPLLYGLIMALRCAAFIPGIIAVSLPPGGIFLMLSLASESRGATSNAPTASSSAEPEPLPIKPAPPKPTKFVSASDPRIKAHGGRISLRHLDLTRPPSEEELRQCGQLGSPLSPSHSADPKKIKDITQRKAQENDNLLFGQAMQKWNEHHYGEAVALFRKHRQSYTDSPWAGEAQLHLGCQAQFSGDWDGAKYSFEWILGNQEKGSDIWQKAKLRRAVLHYEQGELDNATKTFSEMLTTETSWERKTYAHDWLLRLNQIKEQQVALRVCGRDSIVCVLEARGDKTGADKAKKIVAPGDRGFSLGELQRFAHEMSLPAIAIRAEVTKPELLTVPFIAHYKDEHFVTVTGIEPNGIVKIFDSRLGRITALGKEQFTKQWSGLALIFGTLPKETRLASNTELDQEVGGCCGVPKPESDLGDDDDCSCNGLPKWHVNPVNMNVVVADVPIWLDSPVGPQMEIRLTYNSQDALNQYRPFGNKWSFNYTSYAMESPSSAVTGSSYSAGTVLLIMPDGRRDVYSPLQPYAANQIGTYTPSAKVLNRLEKVETYAWNLTLPNGTVYRYEVPLSMRGNSATSMLVSIKDRFGNALNMSYSDAGLISGVADSMGHSFTFHYDDSTGTVSRVSDSFGREATFSYTNGNLTGQTDMGGLVYSYSYDANVYLTSIGKPGGTWLFYIEPNDGINNNSNSYPQPGAAMWQNYRITVTNPLNYKEEFYFNGYSHYGWHRDANQYASSLPALSAPKTRYNYSAYNYSGATGSPAVVKDTIYADGTTVAGTVTQDDFNANWLAQTITDQNGHTKHLSYNAQGMILTSTNARNYVTTCEYEDYGNADSGQDLKTITQAGHLVQEITHYPSNSKSYRNIKTIADGLGRTVSLTYNDFGQIQTRTLPDSTVQTYWYKTDGSHQLEKITQGAGNQTIQSFAYDNVGRVESVTDQDGFTRTFQYDGLNRIIRVTYPDQTFEESGWGCCVIDRKTDRNGQSTWFFYDRANQLRVRCDPAGTLTRFRYDPAGNLTHLIDGKSQTTQWLYDARNRVSDKIFADYTTCHYTYDAVGNLQTATDPYQRTTKYDFDENNNLTYITVQGTAPDIAQVHFTYDELDHRKTMADGLATTTWDYDAAGQNQGITAVGNGITDTIVLGYDAFGRNTSRTVNGVSVSSQFDAAGRLQWVATLSGTYNYTYPVVTGTVGTLTTKVASISYPKGQVTTFDYYPNAPTANQVSGDQRLKTMWNKTESGQTLSKFDYQYDPTGQITNWHQQASSATSTAYDFGYDVNNQLNDAVLKNAETGEIQKHYGYGYDLAGNRNNETIGSSSATEAVTRDEHNNLNQITEQTIGGAIPIRGTSSKPLSSVTINTNAGAIISGTKFSGLASVVTGTNTVTVVAKDQSSPVLSSTNQYSVTVANGASTATALHYDLNGNLLGDGTRTFEWDSRNRLTAVNNGTHRTEFAYDGLDRRVGVAEKEKVEGSQDYTVQSNKRLIWVGLEIAEERNVGTNDLTKLYNRNEMTIVSGSNAGTYFYTRDHLGSVRELTSTDSAGTVTVRARYDYDPYGRQTKVSGNIDADFGFTGHYMNAASGLTLAPYRAYDAGLGRWISRDPLGEAGGLNLYEYANNSPVVYIDSDGKFPFIPVAIGAYALYKAYKAFDALKKASDKAFEEGQRRRKCQNDFDGNADDVNGLGTDMNAYNDVANNLGDTIKYMPGTSFTGRPAFANPGPSSTSPSSTGPVQWTSPSTSNPTFAPPLYGRSAY